MEQIIGAFVRFGVARDIAVNLVTELAFFLVFGVGVVWASNWLRERREASRSDRLLKRAYRSADQSIVYFLEAGAIFARLKAGNQNSTEAVALGAAKRRLADAWREAGQFDDRFVLVGAGLSRGAFTKADEVSNGLAFIIKHSTEMAGKIGDWTREIEEGRPKAAVFQNALKLWMDILELSAENLGSRSAALRSDRSPPRRRVPIKLEFMRQPTGGLSLFWLTPVEIAELTRAIWRPVGVDRVATEDLLSRPATGRSS